MTEQEQRIQTIFRNADASTKTMMLTVNSILIERNSSVVRAGVDQATMDRKHHQFLEASDRAFRAVLAEMPLEEATAILDNAIEAREQFDQVEPAIQELMLSRVLPVAVHVPGSKGVMS